MRVASVFQQAVQGDRRCVFAYEAVPPPANAHSDEIQRAAEQLSATLKPVAGTLDALLFPEIDPGEVGTDGTIRQREPWLPPREYAQMVRKQLSTEQVLFRRTVDHTAPEHREWLRQTAALGFTNIVLVGGDSSQRQYHGIRPVQLAQIIETLNGSEGTAHFQGGICIPWRGMVPRNGRSFSPDPEREPRKMLEKDEAGIGYHVTQILYETGNLQRTWELYRRRCAEAEREPVRVLLGIAPMYAKGTMEFLEWLGVVIPDHVKQHLFADEYHVFQRSLDYLTGMVAQFFEYAMAKDEGAKLGVYVECLLPKSRRHINGSLELLGMVQDRLAQYLAREPLSTGQPVAKPF